MYLSSRTNFCHKSFSCSLLSCSIASSAFAVAIGLSSFVLVLVLVLVDVDVDIPIGTVVATVIAVGAAIWVSLKNLAIGTFICTRTIAVLHFQSFRRNHP